MPDPENPTGSGNVGTPLFTIDRQELLSQYNPDGPPTETWRVYFTTRRGTKAWTDVPVRSYTVENVARQVTEYAKQIEDIHGIGG
jgi:hypothetical protein